MSKSLRSPIHVAVVSVLVATRREAGVTQEDLARRLGWHRSRIAKIESRERRIDVPEFIAIAAALLIPAPILCARVLSWVDPRSVLSQGIHYTGEGLAFGPHAMSEVPQRAQWSVQYKVALPLDVGTLSSSSR